METLFLFLVWLVVFAFTSWLKSGRKKTSQQKITPLERPRHEPPQLKKIEIYEPPSYSKCSEEKLFEDHLVQKKDKKNRRKHHLKSMLLSQVILEKPKGMSDVS